MSTLPPQSVDSSRVTVRLDSHDLITVEPPIVRPEEYGTTRIELVDVPRGSQRLTQLRVPLVDPHRVSPRAGLVEAIVYDLQSAGYPVQLHRPALNSLGRTHTRARPSKLADFLKTNPRGLIQYDCTTPGQLVRDIARQFPDATMAVSTAGKARAQRLHRQLEAQGVAATLLSSRHEPYGSCERIVVGTFGAMRHTPVESNKRDLFLVPRATEALHRSAADCLVQANFRCRVFGFLTAGERVTPDENDRLAAIFGFREITVPGECMQAVTPMVVPWTFRRGRRLDPNLLLSELRQVLERDGMRHRELVKIAHSVWNNELREHASRPDCDQVIVLTDSVFEAGKLGAMLGCPVAIPPDADLRALPDHVQRALANRPGWATGPGPWVATTGGAERIALPDAPGLTVLIWAGAGKALPALPVSWLRTPEGCERQLLLVDFQDRQHWQLKQWNKSRSREYQRVGWLPPGEDPTIHRIRVFLNRCGRGEST